MRQVFEFIFQVLEYFFTDILEVIFEWIFGPAVFWVIAILLLLWLAAIFVLPKLFESIIYVIDAVMNRLFRKK
jgi:hypothetical protein